MTGREYNRARWHHYGLVGSCIWARNNLHSVLVCQTTTPAAKSQALRVIAELDELKSLLATVRPFAELKETPK